MVGQSSFANAALAASPFCFESDGEKERTRVERKRRKKNKKRKREMEREMGRRGKRKKWDVREKKSEKTNV